MANSKKFHLFSLMAQRDLNFVGGLIHSVFNTSANLLTVRRLYSESEVKTFTKQFKERNLPFPWHLLNSWCQEIPLAVVIFDPSVFFQRLNVSLFWYFLCKCMFVKNLLIISLFNPVYFIYACWIVFRIVFQECNLHLHGDLFQGQVIVTKKLKCILHQLLFVCVCFKVFLFFSSMVLHVL